MPIDKLKDDFKSIVSSRYFYFMMSKNLIENFLKENFFFRRILIFFNIKTMGIETS